MLANWLLFSGYLSSEGLRAPLTTAATCDKLSSAKSSRRLDIGAQLDNTRP